MKRASASCSQLNKFFHEKNLLSSQIHKLVGRKKLISVRLRFKLSINWNWTQKNVFLYFCCRSVVMFWWNWFSLKETHSPYGILLRRVLKTKMLIGFSFLALQSQWSEKCYVRFDFEMPFIDLLGGWNDIKFMFILYSEPPEMILRDQSVSTSITDMLPNLFIYL